VIGVPDPKWGEAVKAVDFASPPGEPALTGPDSVSWRVFKNPVSLFIGGVAAVILELAEPRVRHGVWDHTSFRTDPVRRLRRTGLAAMVTVYGARSRAEAMIAGVGRLHGRVSGQTDAGLAYRADDVELLGWVQATASYGFAEAYHRYARRLTAADFDRLYAEAAPALEGLDLGLGLDHDAAERGLRRGVAETDIDTPAGGHGASPKLKALVRSPGNAPLHRAAFLARLRAVQ
jgi:uncharacterized protein (DUF2236 family)